MKLKNKSKFVILNRVYTYSGFIFLDTKLFKNGTTWNKQGILINIRGRFEGCINSTLRDIELIRRYPLPHDQIQNYYDHIQSNKSLV